MIKKEVNHMRIISKFKDYYDGINPSQEPIWIRKNEEFSIKDENKKTILSKSDMQWCKEAYLTLKKPDVNFVNLISWSGNPIEKFILCICGKFIPVYEFKEKFFIDEQKISDYYNSIIKKGKPYYKPTSVYAKGFFNILPLKEWLNVYNNKERLIKIHLSLQSPIFLIYKEHNDFLIEINPFLKKRKMHNCFNAWSLYQEMEQFLSNEMVQCNNPPVEISDVDKRDKHGMDKWSFKKWGKNSK
jgi:hypothetical protein